MSNDSEREETEEEKRARRAVQFGQMRKFRHGEADEDLEYVRFWMSRSVEERINAVFSLRMLHYGEAAYRGVGPREAFECTKRKRG